MIGRGYALCFVITSDNMLVKYYEEWTNCYSADKEFLHCGVVDGSIWKHLTYI